jgi:hypothetical protein
VAVYFERGKTHTTVKDLIETDGLTDRYFFESFANSEELLIASFNAVTYGVLEEITGAARQAGRSRVARARAMLHTYFAALQREPRSARVFLVEIRGVSRAVDKAFDTALRAIGAEVARYLVPPGVPADPLLEAGIVGGVIHIALRWIEDGYEPDIGTVTDSALRLGMVLGRPARASGTAAALAG